MFMLPPSWRFLLDDIAVQWDLAHIEDFLLQEKKSWYIVFPAESNVFSALERTPFDQVKVVILGQDPYHGVGEAHGLSFSVPHGCKIPPSLRNIFKELYSDLGVTPLSTDLTPRAEQGVLLLNSTLTVRKDTPNSHKDFGWQSFTDALVKAISDRREGVIFLLWWAYAQSKKSLIDTNKHIVLESPHPSPFSAHKWFLWCKHFSRVNEILKSQGKLPIVWG